VRTAASGRFLCGERVAGLLTEDKRGGKGRGFIDNFAHCGYEFIVLSLLILKSIRAYQKN
jgi:hypothetical protein